MLKSLGAVPVVSKGSFAFLLVFADNGDLHPVLMLSIFFNQYLQIYPSWKPINDPSSLSATGLCI